MGGVKTKYRIWIFYCDRNSGDTFVDVAVSDISKQVYLETGGRKDPLAHSFRELYILLQNKSSHKDEHCGSSSLIYYVCYHNVILFRQSKIL